jgi:hypothetical protein
VQRIRHVKRWVAHMGVVGKGSRVQRRLCGRVRDRSGAGAHWPFGQVSRWAWAGFVQRWAGMAGWPRARIGNGLHCAVGQAR